MNALSLRFPNREHADLAVGPGINRIGRDPEQDRGLKSVETSLPALFEIVNDRRGLWLHVEPQTWGVHVNGRPVQRLAWLRAGDVLHAEGHEMQLVREPGQAAGPGALPGMPMAMALRGLGGERHGQALVVDKAAVLPGVHMEPTRGGLAVHADSPAQLRINGLPCGEGVLLPGDQLQLADGSRFQLECQRRAVDPAAMSSTVSQPGAQSADGVRMRVPWLLLAAVLIAAMLLGLLWFGAR